MATPGNTNGAVVLYDGENPRTFTGRAREAISGGEFVFVSGGTGVVGATSALFSTGSIDISLVAASDRFNGIALNTVASGGNVTVATRGAYLLLCGGSVFGGMKAETIGDSVAVQSLSSGGVPTGLHSRITANKIIGRAWSDGASGGFALVDIQA